MHDPQLGPDAGGNFFACTHGIKVEAAADTVVVWGPKLWHGTSLKNVDPDSSKVFQAGLVIVTPPGITRLWKEVQEKKISLQEAKKRILELESGETSE